MAVVAEIYNWFAPIAGYVWTGLWLITSIPLCILFYKYRSTDAVCAFLYLSGMTVPAWVESIWLDPTVLVVIHQLLFMSLYAMHYFFRALGGRYGDRLMSLAALVVLVDVVAVVLEWHLAIHLSLVNLLFVVMCLLTLRQSWNARHCDGIFGRCQYDAETDDCQVDEERSDIAAHPSKT